jgi:hypothetical protein
MFCQYSTQSLGKCKIILVFSETKEIKDFKFEIITEQEYNEKVELVNNIFKQSVI